MAARAARRRAVRGPAAPAAGVLDLVLYVGTPCHETRSALANLSLIVERHLQGRYRLDVVDLRKNPQLARDQSILTVPMLVKRLPLPVRRFVGDLADEEKVLLGLGLVDRRQRRAGPASR